MKLLFLLTALCSESRAELKKIINLLVEILQYTLQKAAENHMQHQDLPPIYLTVSILSLKGT